MIRIKVLRKDNVIKKVNLDGHANYDVYGKDIVCAAVSATYLCTVNAILSIDSDSIKFLDNENNQGIEVVNNNKYVNILLDNMIRCLDDLERQYPTHVKLDKEEIQ